MDALRQVPIRIIEPNQLSTEMGDVLLACTLYSPLASSDSINAEAQATQQHMHSQIEHLDTTEYVDVPHPYDLI
jgi:hypothetical protein